MNDNLKIIDFSHLNSIVSGDENFKKELIVIFLEQIPVFVNNMKEYLEKNKPEKLAREAHTAKSSVLIFGMANTGRLLKEMQLLAESKNTTDISPIFRQVVMELSKARTELLAFLEEV